MSSFRAALGTLASICLLWGAGCKHEAAPSDGPAPLAASVTGSAAAPASSPTGGLVRNDDEVCNALTNGEVTRELNQVVTSKRLPKSGEYSAPSCGWFTADAPDKAKVEVTVFTHSDDGKARFKSKLKTVCKEDRVDVSGLGDEAAVCGLLWVRKGDYYYSVGPRGGSFGPDVAVRLARRVLAHLP